MTPGEKNDCIFLYSCSNVDIFHNDKLLSNFTTDPRDSLKLASNGGTMVSKTKGIIEKYGQVWYNPKSLANILSLANVRKNYRVTMDTGPSDTDPKMIVHVSDLKKLIFREMSNVLFGLSIPHPTSSSATSVCATTVAENESEFTKRDLKRAKTAMELYKKFGRPGYQHFFTFSTIISFAIALSPPKVSDVPCMYMDRILQKLKAVQHDNTTKKYSLIQRLIS